MFVPIGDQPNPRGVAVVNWLLIAANVAVFLLVSLPLMGRAIDLDTPGVSEYVRHMAHLTGMPPLVLLHHLSAYDLFVFNHAFRPGVPTVSGLFASLFLHAGWAHLLGNMLFLWIFGDNVEARLGRLRYLVCYLATGVAAAVFHSMFQGNANLPMLGASGAISGVLGFYFVWFPQNQVRMLLFLYFIWDVYLIPARIVLAFYLLVDNLLPFLIASDSGGVAHGAHIGGFLAGVALAYWLDFSTDRGSRRTYVSSLGREAPPEKEAPPVIRWLDADRPDLAVAEFFEQPAARQAAVPPAQLLAMVDELVEKGQPQVALALMRQYLALHRGTDGTAPIHLRLALVYLYHLRRPTDAYQHLRRAMFLGLPPELEEHALRALSDIDKLQKLQFRRRG